MSNMLRKRYKLVFWSGPFVFILLAALWWLSRPDRTWQRLAHALEPGIHRQAELLCDGSTVRIAALEDRQVLFSVRADVAHEWLSWPGVYVAVPNFLDAHHPSVTQCADRL